MIDKLNGCIFWLKDDSLLEKYNTIWDSIWILSSKKGFDSEPVYDKNFCKPK